MRRLDCHSTQITLERLLLLPSSSSFLSLSMVADIDGALKSLLNIEIVVKVQCLNHFSAAWLNRIRGLAV